MVDMRKLTGSNSRLIEKAKKYQKLSNELNLDFFICCHIDFVLGISPKDFITHLTGEELSGHDGAFNDTNNPLSSVCAVLLSYNNNYKWITNPNLIDNSPLKVISSK